MLSWIISSSILILLMMALRAAVKDRVSPRLRYALWLVVLARLLLPVSLGSVPFSVLSVMERAEEQAQSRLQLPAVDVDPVLGYVGGETLQLSVPDSPEMTPAEYQAAWDQRQEEIDKFRSETGTPVRLSNLLLVIWAVGAAVTAAVLLSVNVGFYGSLKRRGRLLGAFRGLPVYTAENLMSPCLAGLRRPAVFITPELARCEVARTHIMAHEYTHYRQKDHIWSALRGLCLALHWYNPLVWWAAAASRRDCELSCDAGAVQLLGEQARAAYGRTVVSMVAPAAMTAEVLRCATTMAGGNSAVKERVTLLVKDPRTKTATFCAVALLAVAIAGCTFTGPARATDQGKGPETGIDTFLRAARAGDAFDAVLCLTGPNGPETLDAYQFSDREAVETLTADMGRCLWQEWDSSALDNWKGYSLLLQTGDTALTFCDDGPETLVRFSDYEAGRPVVRIYRAALPETLRDSYTSSFNLFYRIYETTCPASGGTPAAVPAYKVTTTERREAFTDNDGRELAFCELTLPVLFVSNGDALPENLLTAAYQTADTFNAEMERQMNAAKDRAASYEDAAREMLDQGRSGDLPLYQCSTSTVRVQGQLISVFTLWEDYSGGVHPNYGYSADLFDLSTGRFLSAADVADDPAAFAAGVGALLTANAERLGEAFQADAWEDWRDTVQNWTENAAVRFMEGGLYAAFDPYLLGSYAMGGVELFAGYEDLWDLLGEGGREKLGLTEDYLAQTAARKAMLETYAGILELAFSGEQSEYDYYDYNQTDPAEIARNSFAVFDVDGDGADELIINYNNTYTAGMNVTVYGYDTATGEVREELRDFSAAGFYDNGYAAVDASHNHGRNAMRGDWWPYSLYRWDGDTDTYRREAIVDAWDREWRDVYNGQRFPEDADADGDGVVYYAEDGWDYGKPMDGAAYAAWVESWRAGAEKMEIPYQALTRTNIDALR